MLEAIRTPESSLEGCFLTYVNRANFHSLLAVSVIPFVTFSIQPQQSDTRKLYTARVGNWLACYTGQTAAQRLVLLRLLVHA